MKKILVITFYLLASACSKNISHFSKANVYFNEYLISHDPNYLDSSYQSLKSGNYLNNNKNSDSEDNFVVTLLFYMRRYDEIENFMKTNKTFSSDKKEHLLNLSSALKIYKSDSSAAIGYISQNLNNLKTRIDSSPNDSLLLTDYFSMRIYIVGKQQALFEVDSLKKSNTHYSDFFYNHTLVDLIKEYPDELLFQKQQ